MSADASAVVARPMRLRGILHYYQFMFFCQCEKFREVCGLTEEVHRDQGARSGSNCVLNPSGIEVPVTSYRLYPYRACTGLGYREPGCDEGVRWHDDLITRTDPECPQREGKGVTASRDAYRMLRVC